MIITLIINYLIFLQNSYQIILPRIKIFQNYKTPNQSSSSMQNLSIPKIKLLRSQQFPNQYSYLNTLKDRNQFKCLSLDLSRIQKNKRLLPIISNSKRQRMEGMISNLERVKKNIQEQEETQDNAMISPYSIPYQIQYPYSYSSNYPYSYPYSYPYFYPYSYQNSYPNYSNYQTPTEYKKPKKRGRNKKQKIVNQPNDIKRGGRNGINKFRVCGYVVYFAIFIKYYSDKFTENRRKWFVDRYSKRNGGIIFQGSQQVLQKLLSLDLYTITHQSKTTKRRNGQNLLDASFEEHEQKFSSHHLPKQKISTGQYLINILQIFFERLSEILTNKTFLSEYHETFSAGSLDKMFLIDNLYLPEQVPFLFIHPKRGYLRLDYQSQINILLIKIFIKMVIYNYLLSNERNKNFYQHLRRIHELAQFEIEELLEITRIIGVYLYEICKEIYMDGLKNIKHVSNFYFLAKKYNIKQAKYLQQLEPSPNTDVSQNPTKKSMELIKNIKNYSQIKAKLNKNYKLQQYKQLIKQKIYKILHQVYQIIKAQQKNVYVYIKNLTLSQSYIIFEGMEVTKNKNQVKRKGKNYYGIGHNKEYTDWNNLYPSLPSKQIPTNNSYVNDLMADQILKPFESKDNHYTRLPHKNNGKSQNNCELIDEKFITRMEQKKKQNVNFDKIINMKKPFNIDTINTRFDENRQDRLRQKFRQLLGNQNSIQQNN